MKPSRPATNLLVLADPSPDPEWTVLTVAVSASVLQELLQDLWDWF